MALPRILWVLALLASPLPPAQASVDHYDVHDGLSQNSVVAMETDARGFLWLGTEDGLNRFDGHAFKVFRSEPGEPGLPDSFVQQLARVDETLWIGTIGGGLARMDLPSERTEALSSRLPDAIPARNTIFALAPVDAENAVVASTDGIHEVHWPLNGDPARSRAIGRDAGLQGDLVRALARLPDGRLMVGGGLDLCLFDAALSRCQEVLADAPWPRRRPPVMALSVDGRSRIWISFDGYGLARWNPDTGDVRWLRFGSADLPPQLARVSTLRAIGDGDLWIGSDAGLYRYAADCDCVGPRLDPENEEDPAARKIVYSLLPDGEDRVWIGAWNHGFDRYDPQRQAIERWRPHLPGKPSSLGRGVRAILPLGDTLWLGIYGLGVIEARGLDQGRPAWSQPDSLAPATVPASLVWAVVADDTGRLWIGSDQGLSRWHPETGLQPLLPATIADGRKLALRGVRALLRDDRNRLWAGGEEGLFRVDLDDPALALQRIASESHELPDRRIFALHQDPGGRIWIGTWQGVFAFDGETGKAGASLAPDAHLRLTWDIADAADGGLWIGTSDGLVHVGKDGRWRRYTERDGLANRVIYGIESDLDGRLWLSSNRGIIRFDPRDGSTVNFGVQDQLQHTEFLFGAHARDPRGRLLFGGPAGFNRIDPARVADSDRPPRPVLTGVRIDGIEIEPGLGRIDRAAPSLARLTVMPTDSVLELHYGAIAHDQPRNVRFRHRLAGFDRDWQPALDRRFASYTNLPPGRYLFEIEAIGRFGQRSESPRTLQVVVVPWWWETLAFRVSLAVLGLLLLALAVRWRLSDLRGQRESLRLQVAERTGEIQRQRDELARANDELAVLSSHDVLTGLANRRSLLATLGEAIASARNEGRALSVALVDLDHFKRINDSRGHAVGDQALVHLAALWSPLLPAGAAFGRYGGEEFLLVLPGMEAPAATALVAQLLQQLRRTPVTDVTPSLVLTASCGVAALISDDSLDSLVHRADQALYRAKNAGRDQVASA